MGEGEPRAGPPPDGTKTPAEARVLDLVARADASLKALDGIADPEARRIAATAVQAILELYGEALARVSKAARGGRGDALGEAILGDDLIWRLLVVHDLHPEDAETRVQRALEDIRPELESLGGRIEGFGVTPGAVRVRIAGGLRGLTQLTESLRRTIEDAVRAAAPEMERVEVVTPDDDLARSSPAEPDPPVARFLRFGFDAEARPDDPRAGGAESGGGTGGPAAGPPAKTEGNR